MVDQVEKSQPMPQPQQVEPSNTLIVKIPTKFFAPTFMDIEILYINNVGLEDLCLQGLQFLYELSAEGNRLTHMNFLDYEENENLETVHLSSNQIRVLWVPPHVGSLTVSMNQIHDLEALCLSIRDSSLTSLDLSGNLVSELFNFKFEVLAVSSGLTKLNGQKVTTYDIDAVVDYKTIVDRKPPSKTISSSYYQRFDTHQSKMGVTTTTGFFT